MYGAGGVVREAPHHAQVLRACCGAARQQDQIKSYVLNSSLKSFYFLNRECQSASKTSSLKLEFWAFNRYCHAKLAISLNMKEYYTIVLSYCQLYRTIIV